MQKLFFIFLSLLVACITGSAQLCRFQFSQPKMGSPFNLIFYSNDSAYANNIAAQCFGLVDSLNHIFSDYDSTSELNRLAGRAQQSPVPVSPAMLDIWVRSQTAYQKSNGTFDITAGALNRLWRTARKENRFPEAAMVNKARAYTGFRYVQIDTVAKTVFFTKAGIQPDLGGIAKGYTAQQVINFLKQQGITHALVDAGGDIATSGAPPHAKGWTIGINVPETENDLLDKRIILQDGAVATSGDVYQYIEHGGKKYSHITNPRTGYGVTAQRNVTVIAPDGATADWLATACSILPVKKAKKLALSMHAQVLIATLRRGKPLFYFTKGFANYLTAAN